MPFGLKKKEKSGDDDDSNRSALFSSRKKDKGAAAPSSNPYAAAAPSNDPYGNPPPYSGGPGSDRYRQEKTPAVTGPGGQYGGNQAGVYRSQGGSYAGAGGYGSDRYGAGSAEQGPPRRAGGYGGLGNADADVDAGRQELFGNATQRRQERQQQPGGYGQSGASGASGAYGQSGAYGAEGAAGGYGAYQDRQLTAEEQEEEDVNATKSEIKFIKQQDVSSTRNALRLAEQAEQTGRDTLQRLGAQGERIHNTERNLDLASSQNRIASEKARELKTLNKSMFAVHVGNPFTSSSRREERDRKLMEAHQMERAQRDATRQAAWESSARAQQASQRTAAAGSAGGLPRSTLADRAKYQFEADSEDDEMENEIDNNLDQLHGAAKRLNALGRAMGEEVETQNKHIDRIITKTDKVDDELMMNRARLDRIH